MDEGTLTVKYQCLSMSGLAGWPALLHPARRQWRWQCSVQLQTSSSLQHFGPLWCSQQRMFCTDILSSNSRRGDDVPKKSGGTEVVTTEF